MKKVLAIIVSVIILTVAFVPVQAAGGNVYSNGSTGEMVVRIQLRLAELGYLDYQPTGAYRSMTVEAVKAFQQRCCDMGNSTSIDGIIGEETMKLLFSNSAPRAKIPDSVHMVIGPSADNLVATGEAIDWGSIKSQLKVGISYEVTDCNTGDKFWLTFSGGENHAEMELKSNDDIEAFMKICGDEFNFYKRPVIISIDGRNVAASIQCYPHGTDSVADNGMDGHICVFFMGSLSHVGQLPDLEHNSNVYKAAGR